MNIQFFSSLNSWKDFEHALVPLNKKEKGNAFEQLTKFYFQFDPVHRTYYDDIWLFSEVPSKHLEILGLPAHDLGIDLIARIGEEYHAIQCKYHTDNTTSVTFKEVATFLSLFESNSKITKGYICSSADLTSKNLDKVRSEHISLVLSDTWNNLSGEFFESVKSELLNKKVKLRPFKPKAHQVKAIAEAKKHFLDEQNNRGKLIFPCGAGKSLTGFWMTQELGAKSIVVAVPSLSLVKQTLDVYLREIVAHGQKVKWLCICSDEGIGKGDDIAIRTENIGVPCITDPQYIENWLTANRTEAKIIFTTYQSGRIIADVAKKLNFTFDLGIFDEAHKTVGSDKKLFSHLLFEENISIHKRIFMTATERFYAGSKDDIISMDNEDIYGETFTQMSFKEAIDTGLLTDYKVITIDVKRSEIASFIQENKLVELNGKWTKETEARSLASMLALRKAMKLFPIHNAVSFHSSIEKAVRNKELQQFITDSFHYEEIDTFTVSGEMPTTKRNEIVREFADSSKALITNARCLTEGVDVPNIDCIVFADPRKSKVDIVQALGRALRKKEGKDWGYVILPVIYDDVTHEIDNENFNEILAIVRGLASNDERIVEYFKDKNNDQPIKQSDKGEQFHFDVFSDSIDVEELSSQLQIKLWEKLSRFNWMPFEEAREFVRFLGLKDWNDWQKYSKTASKPANIPAHPIRVYKDSGWLSFGDWLGTGSIATGKRVFKPYDEAREFAVSLNLKNQTEWFKFTKMNILPLDIPTNPQRTYKDKGWVSFGVWLGTGRVATASTEFLPFQSAREIVHKFEIKNEDEWRLEVKKSNFPLNIPKTPSRVYAKSGWLSWGDWLGTKPGYNRDFLSFLEARKFVQSLGLKRQKDWLEYCKSGKKPIKIPSNPNWAYRDLGWVSFGDWLGSGHVANSSRTYLPFVQARDYARKLYFSRVSDWSKHCKSGLKPDNIPWAPSKTYKTDGWISMADWLGIDGTLKPSYLPFEEARVTVRSLKIGSQLEYKKAIKEGLVPKNIPSNPNTVYLNKGWVSYPDWLGNGRMSNQNRLFLSFNEAKVFVRSLQLKSCSEWVKYKSSGLRPENVPSAPDQKYKQEWKGWSDFLGNE
jgi:superfamily II DNA or RNA helicase